MKKTSISYPSGLSVDEIVNYINSSDEMLQLQAIQSYERLGEEKNFVNDMIKRGIVSRYIELLESNNISLLFEVTSLLNTITSSTRQKCDKAIYYQLIPNLIKLLKHTSSTIGEQALYVLRNIIDTPYAREIALTYDVVRHLVDIIKLDTSITLMDGITWLLSNLCQKNRPLSLGNTKSILRVLNCLLNIENDYIISDTCRILSYLTDGSKSNVQVIMGTGILPKLLKCLASCKKSIFIPALLTVRNIVEFGNDAHKDAIITAGGLSVLRIVLSNCFVNEEDIEREAFWIIGKVAGNTDQIQSIIDAGLVKTLISRIAVGNVQTMAAWVLTSMITSGTAQQFIRFVNSNVLLAYCALLHSNDYYNILCALTGLTKVLLAAENVEQREIFVIILKEARAFDKIEALQYDKDERLYKQSVSIVKLCSFQKLYTSEDQLLKSNIGIDEVRPNLSTETAVAPTPAIPLQAFQFYKTLLLRPEVNHYSLEVILPLIFKHLDGDDPRSLLEAMNLLTDIIESKYIKMQYIIKHGAVQKLVKQLKSTSSTVVKHASVILLEKIITASPYARDLALEHNALPILIGLIKPDTPIESMYTILWTITYLNERVDSAKYQELIHTILPLFNRLLNIENPEICSDTCRILSYLTDGSKSNVQVIMGTGILPKLLKCLASCKKSIFIPALLTVRNIVEFGNDAHKDAIINAGGLSVLRIVLSNCFVNEEDIEREAFWIIGKVAGNTDQIQSIIDAGLVKTLISRIAVGNVQTMAAWVVTSMITSGTAQQFIRFVNSNVLLAYCALLHTNDYYNILCALTGLTKVLLAAENVEQREIFVIILKEARAFDKIEALQYDKDERLYKQSVSIVKLCSFQKVLYILLYMIVYNKNIL
ncbi:Importin subunit alpha-2 [Cyphomyrmex costatus]|uniref:Importin subunit alpha-2 n=1 Tax=Cyphomyrmex costatus TaxID=456900 RepID=A0A151I8G8_9HYME|nr:Importin subunit alpha-2 [Cyphomyrmex costatus]